MMKNHYLITLILSLASLMAPAAVFAGVPVKGVVTDTKGEPLVGAMVYEPGTSTGTMTDVDGSYSITLSSADASISFSSIGYTEPDN